MGFRQRSLERGRLVVPRTSTDAPDLSPGSEEVRQSVEKNVLGTGIEIGDEHQAKYDKARIDAGALKYEDILRKKREELFTLAILLLI